jgi:hypothetical protein
MQLSKQRESLFYEIFVTRGHCSRAAHALRREEGRTKREKGREKRGGIGD